MGDADELISHRVHYLYVASWLNWKQQPIAHVRAVHQAFLCNTFADRPQLSFILGNMSQYILLDYEYLLYHDIIPGFTAAVKWCNLYLLSHYIDIADVYSSTISLC